MHWLGLVLDGKRFADDAVVMALGVTATGEQRILGLVQMASEHTTVCAQCLRGPVARGFLADAGLLVVRDGGKGFHAAVREVFGATAVVQRWPWHKRENVVAYLPKGESRRGAASSPPRGPTPPMPRRRPRSCASTRAALAERVGSASMLEGLEETVTLHRLCAFPQLGTALKTTNTLESVMARVEQRTARVDRWRTSDQKQRWRAAALLTVEARFRRVKGHEHLPLLARALAPRGMDFTRDAA